MRRPLLLPDYVFLCPTLSLSVSIQIQTARCATIFLFFLSDMAKYLRTTSPTVSFCFFLFLFPYHLHPHPPLTLSLLLHSHRDILKLTQIRQSKEVGSSIASLSQTPVILRSLQA